MLKNEMTPNRLLALSLAFLATVVVLYTAVSNEQNKETEIAPFSERLQAAYDREQHLFDSGATWKMVQGTNNVIDEFFPEAARKLAGELGISVPEAEDILRERMKLAYEKTHEDYIREYGGYGTIIQVLAAAEALHVICMILEEEEGGELVEERAVK